MKTTTKKLTDTRVEVKVTLDSADLKPAREQALERLAKDMKLPGFRKGKAPAALVEQKADQNEITNLTLDIAVRTTMPHAFEQAKQDPIAIENVNVTKYVPGDTLEYTATADILPDVKLGDFRKLKAKMENFEASEQDIQEILDNVARAYAERKVAKKAAELGDEVILDFVGRKDGQPFDGGSAKDHHLDLGSGHFIAGFEEGIVGHSAGDKFDLELTFPKDYPEKSLAGQKTVFDVLVKQVNEVKQPAFDDELAKKCGNFATIDDLKADIKKNIESQKKFRAIEKYRDALVQELVEKSKVSAPEVLLHDQLRFIRDDFTRNAAAHSLTLEQYLEEVGETMESWEKIAHKIAEDRVKSSLVLQILARDQKITASEEEVDAKIAELRDVYRRSSEALKNLKKPEVRQDIRNRLIIDKTLDFLVAANGGDAIMNQAPEAAEKKPAKAAKKSKKSA